MRQEGGFWRLARHAADVQVPETIEGVIRSRIDDLPSDQRRLLQEATVLGQSFELRLLSAYASAAQSLDELLSKLVRADLLIEDGEAIRFRHNLVRDVAYESLLMRSREGCSHAAETIQQLYKDRLAEFVPMLAEHYDRATDFDRALPYLRESADRATAMFAHAEAARLHGKVLDSLRRLGADPLDQAAVCELLAPAEAAHGNFDAALEHWRWAADAYEKHGEDRTLADVRRAMGVALFARGELAAARESFDVAHSAAAGFTQRTTARGALSGAGSTGLSFWRCRGRS